MVECCDPEQGKPAHGNVEDRRDVFRTVDEEELDQRTDGSRDPDGDQQVFSLYILHEVQAQRRIGAGDQIKDADVVDLLERSCASFRKDEGMVGAAGAVENDETQSIDA